ncbi:MAG: hypothetical protein IJ423_00740 [Clostridia bacterium]|nr:hypothetical protein [Clostridia bacterium]
MQHYHTSIDKKKEDKKIKSRALLFLILGLIALVPYLSLELFPFITSIYAHHKINISTMCYTALRLLLVITPVAITLPSKVYKTKIEKVNLLGKLFAVVSFFFFCGMVADIMSYNIFGGYVDTGKDPIMMKMLLGHIGVGGIIFCFVQGVFYLLLSKKIKGHKRDIVLLFAGTYITYFALPLLMMLITDVPFFTKEWYVWLGKNAYLWVSNVFVLVGLIIASSSRRLWSEIIWK